MIEAAAEVLYGDPNAVVKIDCAEFQHSHEIAKLIGSPPGYLKKLSNPYMDCFSNHIVLLVEERKFNAPARVH